MDHTRVIIVDDNTDSLDILQFYIEQFPGFSLLDRCAGGEQLMEAVMLHQPDVILLDINMPGMDGIETMKACLRLKPELLFIFVTSYHQYAVQAFELSVLDYVVKPIEKTRLFSALDRARRARRKPAIPSPSPLSLQRLLIRENSTSFYIPLADILFVEKVLKKCHIYTAKDTIITSETITSLLKQLPKDTFFMSHRSYILNLARLSSIQAKNQTYLAYFNGSEKYAHISKLKFDELQMRMNAFLA